MKYQSLYNSKQIQRTKMSVIKNKFMEILSDYIEDYEERGNTADFLIFKIGEDDFDRKVFLNLMKNPRDENEEIGPFPHTDEELMIVKNMRACVSLKNIKKMEEEILDKFVDNEKFIKRLYSKEGQNPAQYSTGIAMMDETKVICISNNGTILEYSLYNEEYITRFNRDRSSNQHKKIEYKMHILNVKIPRHFFMGLEAVTGVISGKSYETLNTGSYGGSYYRGTGTDHVVKLMKMIIKLKD